MTKQQRLSLILTVILIIGVVASALVFHRLVNLGLLGLVAVIQFFIPFRRKKEGER
jgi:hypothetical protein